MVMPLESCGAVQLFHPIVPKGIGCGTDLLAVSVKHGVKIVGYPSSCDLEILFVNDKSFIQTKFVLPGKPKILSLNVNETLLAVNYRIDDRSLIVIFALCSSNDSMGGLEINALQSFECPSMAKQILWNPIKHADLAISLENGCVSTCAYRIPKDYVVKQIVQDARCVCWNGERDEIIVAFSQGRLQLFDDKTIRTLHSPRKMFDSLFDPIELKWLEKNQFALILLKRAIAAAPEMFIVNVNGDGLVYDPQSQVRYSSIGTEVYLIHSAKLQLILTGSKNDTQINILRGEKKQETTIWRQIQFLEENMAQLPFGIDDADQFYMLGIVFETETQKLATGSTTAAFSMSFILTNGRFTTIKFNGSVFTNEIENILKAQHSQMLQMKQNSIEEFSALLNEFATNPELNDQMSEMSQYRSACETLNNAMESFDEIVHACIGILSKVPTVDVNLCMEFFAALGATAETNAERLMQIKTDAVDAIRNFRAVNDIIQDVAKSKSVGKSEEVVRNVNDANGNDAKGNNANGNDANRNDTNRNDAETIAVPAKRVKKRPSQSKQKYACDSCSRTYTKEFLLAKHKRTAHPNPIEEVVFDISATNMANDGSSIEIVSNFEEVETNMDVIELDSNSGDVKMEESIDVPPKVNTTAKKTSVTCDLCSKPYASKSSLRHHMKKVHGISTTGAAPTEKAKRVSSSSRKREHTNIKKRRDTMAIPVENGSAQYSVNPEVAESNAKANHGNGVGIEGREKLVTKIKKDFVAGAGNGQQTSVFTYRIPPSDTCDKTSSAEPTVDDKEEQNTAHQTAAAGSMKILYQCPNCKYVACRSSMFQRHLKSCSGAAQAN